VGEALAGAGSTLPAARFRAVQVDDHHVDLIGRGLSRIAAGSPALSAGAEAAPGEVERYQLGQWLVDAADEDGHDPPPI
jgi:hypothetical protein